MKKWIMKIIENLYFKQEGNLALYDKMTGCLNSNYIRIVAPRKYNNKECYVGVIDLNGFKSINDLYGHSMGDKKLVDISDQIIKIKEYIDPDAELIRIGGDEFVIISSVDFERFMSNDVNHLLSYGIVYKPKNQSLFEAIQLADDKMYNYKRNLYSSGVLKDRRNEEEHE